MNPPFPPVRRSVVIASELALLLLSSAVGGIGCGSSSSAKTDATVIAASDGGPADAPLDAANPPPVDSGYDHSSATAPETGALDTPAGIDGSGAALDAAPLDGAALDSGGAGIDGGPLPACTSLVNPLFILTGDTQVPILQAVGKVLRAQANPITLVWYATGSCSIVDTLYAGQNMTENGSYIPSDPSWNAQTGVVPTCAMPAAGVPPDVGIPIVFPQACSTATPPAGLGAVTGPIQSMVFVVPTASSATAISAEEAYLVFGFGQNGDVSPWTNESFYFVRPPSKGTEVSLAAAINVPATKWKGQQINQSTTVASDVATSSSPDETIGILGTEIYDSAANRAVLRSLTFEAYGQDLGYLPDANATSFDKRNVRDGHYVAWSHVFYLTAVDATGTPTNSNVKLLADVFTGGPGATSVGIDSISLLAGFGLTPNCAMTVSRTSEGGALSLSPPAGPCGCAFEAAVGQAPPACTACTTNAECAAGSCSNGFCESADGRTSLADCTAPGADNASITNAACSGRLTSPKAPMPALEQANGGTLPTLP